MSSANLVEVSIHLLGMVHDHLHWDDLATTVDPWLRFHVEGIQQWVVVGWSCVFRPQHAGGGQLHSQRLQLDSGIRE